MDCRSIYHYYLFLIILTYFIQHMCMFMITQTNSIAFCTSYSYYKCTMCILVAFVEISTNGALCIKVLISIKSNTVLVSVVGLNWQLSQWNNLFQPFQCCLEVMCQVPSIVYHFGQTYQNHCSLHQLIHIK